MKKKYMVFCVEKNSSAIFVGVFKKLPIHFGNNAEEVQKREDGSFHAFITMGEEQRIIEYIAIPTDKDKVTEEEAINVLLNS